jgi:hypothetical protein
VPLQPVRRRSSLLARRPDAAWSPGTFSPAIFIVALAVILLLVGVAVASRRGGAGPAPTATAAAAPVPAGGPTATTPPQAAGRVFVVGNTGGQGVYLRRTPRLDDRDKAYADGTRLEQIGEDTTAEGMTWHHVRAPDGRTGWVPAQYTVESR